MLGRQDGLLSSQRLRWFTSAPHFKWLDGALDLGTGGGENQYHVQSRPAGVELDVGREEPIKQLHRAALQAQRAHLMEKVQAVDRKLASLDELP